MSARQLPRGSFFLALSFAFAGAAGCVPDVTPVSTLPSCKGLPLTCGPFKDETCCASPLVEGGEYDRIDEGSKSYTATVSDFRLDRFEVTVGRFRRFVEEYPGNKPAERDGAHPAIEGSGWNAEWSLPSDKEELTDGVLCDEAFQTWTDAPGGSNENKPINCVDWYVAFAFCTWDGGRLPTEAEWNYAAAGGSEEQDYPWGSNEPDETYAAYCSDYMEQKQICATATFASIPKVGSRSTKGDGRWEHADLSGSLSEWNLDYHAPYSNSCNDCAGLTEAPMLPGVREARGGDWVHDESNLTSSIRIGYNAMNHNSWIGFRCARMP